MQMHTCKVCKKLRDGHDPDAIYEEVISYDKQGRFIGATRIMTCGTCVKKEKAVVVDTVEKKPITKDQKRLF